jgi:DnaJ-class molecular chaperone
VGFAYRDRADRPSLADVKCPTCKGDGFLEVATMTTKTAKTYARCMTCFGHRRLELLWRSAYGSGVVPASTTH